MRIAPDEETRSILRNLNIGYRFLGNSFICFIRCKRVAPPADQPKLPIIEQKEENRLRFLLFALPDFINKTFVAHAGGKLVYHFTNRINNIGAGPPVKVFLHNKIQGFIISNDYLEGTIVEHVGDMYGAKKTISHLDNIAITNEDFWEDVGDQHDQFVNNGDLKITDGISASEKSFGVIDIYNTGTVNGYHLFNGSGHLLSPNYIISLKSRI